MRLGAEMRTDQPKWQRRTPYARKNWIPVFRNLDSADIGEDISGDVRRHLMGGGTSGWFLSPHLAKMTGIQE
jgi:hypothetical protein